MGATLWINVPAESHGRRWSQRARAYAIAGWAVFILGSHIPRSLFAQPATNEKALQAPDEKAPQATNESAPQATNKTATQATNENAPQATNKTATQATNENAPQDELGDKPPAYALTLSQTSEVWGNLTGGLKPAWVYTGLLQLGVEVDIEAIGFWKGGSVGLMTLLLQGDDISSAAVGDAGVVSNIAGQASFRFFSAWYEHSLFNNRISLKVGIIPVDDDFMILDAAQLFINSGFGTVQTFALNLSTPIYPLAALGIRLQMHPAPQWTVQLGVYDGDGGDETDHPHIGDLQLDGSCPITSIGELAWRSSSPNLGHIAVGGLLHICRSLDSEDDLFGLGYVMAERQLARLGPSELIIFGHASVAGPSPRTTAIAYIDGGLVVDGGLWRRPADQLGLGFTWTAFASMYRRRQRMQDATVTAHEWVTELTYEMVWASWVRGQVSLQWLMDAHFANNNVLASGFRVTLQL